jgi:MtaA/CmuA family methyltransferase
VDRLPAHPLFMIYAADLVGASYADYVRDHRVLVEGQLALLERFPIDVVSCCSDAWREAHDCGVELLYAEHEPPRARGPILAEPADLAGLRMPDPRGGGRMTDRIRAIEAFAGQVAGEVCILGWVEGPCAEAADLYGLNAFMVATLADPEFARALMDWVTEMEIQFAVAQVEAGADMIGIGDSAASLVSPAFYEDEVLPREVRIVDAIHAAGAVARLHICGSLHGKFAGLAETRADLIDVDYPQSVGEVRAAVGPEVCLAGNLHPVEVILRGTPAGIRKGFARCHAEAGERYVLAAGCEIPPGTPEENVRAMFEYASSAV